MELSIGSIFSKEFSWEERSLSLELTKDLNKFLFDKSYGDIDRIYISAICVSEGFKPFFKLKNDRYDDATKTLEFEFELDYDVFLNLNIHDKKRLLISSFCNRIKDPLIKYRKEIKFDDQMFLKDLINIIEKISL